MRITFVYPDLIGSADYGGIYYLGIGILSSVLEQAGYQTSLVHVTQPTGGEAVARQIRQEAPDLIAFSSTTPMFSVVQSWARQVKKLMPRVPIVVGGVHAILHAEEVISVPEIDYVCTGEGEDALLELCRAIEQGADTSAIANIWSKKNGHIIRTAMRPIITDLDRIPFADRQLFNYRNLMEAREEMFFVMASRGCPYSCPYCCAESLRKIMAGKHSWVRFRSVDNVIAEIQAVLAVFPGAKFIGFYDDVLALDKEWFAEFSVQYKQRVGVPFRCNMRANLMTEEIVRLMHEAGCRRVILGVESGNEFVRNTILKRGMSEDVLLAAAQRCKRYGMELVTNNMIGLPGESARAVLDTVKINARMDVDFTYTSIFYPFPKTALYSVSASQGLLTDRVITDFVEGSTLNFDRLTITRIVFVRNFFRPLMNLYKAVYRFHGKTAAMLERALDWLLTVPVIIATLFPLANLVFRLVRENKTLAAIANRFKRYR